MKREIWIGMLILKYFSIVITFVALFFSCTKDDSNPVPPSPLETVTDIDGNVYRTVVIDTQVWMAENLKVTHYRDGASIPNVTDSTEWSNLTTGAYCNYDNYANNAAIYGRLYNWYAVNDIHNLAPKGWHVPSDTEWQTLRDYLGGDYVAGGKMKESGTEHWNIPNSGATNESGFSALPGGCRSYNGDYYSMSYAAKFWSSTEYVIYDYIIYLLLEYSNSEVLCIGTNHRQFGFSVRCVKD